MIPTKYLYVSFIALLVICAAGLILFFFRLQNLSNPSNSRGGQMQNLATEAVDKDISDSFLTLKTQLTFAENDINLEGALRTFTAIAADERNPAAQRMQALNGIYYAYTASNADADAVRNIVFTNPYFAQYYVAATNTSPDAVRPESGPNVQAVELALAKILAFSNALSPNHYAISRLETAELFAFDRAAVGKSVAERKEIETEYAKKIQALIAAYDALPPLDSITDYLPAMRMQVMYLHASALEFVGQALGDQSYINRGDNEYEKIFAFGASYPATRNDSRGVLNQALFARIFYASHYWRHFKDTNPSKIKDALRPLLDERADKGLAVYEHYLPSKKNSTIGVAWVLRDIATQMPELKVFLQGRGWKF